MFQPNIFPAFPTGGITIPPYCDHACGNVRPSYVRGCPKWDRTGISAGLKAISAALIHNCATNSPKMMPMWCILKYFVAHSPSRTYGISKPCHQ
ncbi:hypothetical protein BBMN23_0050 [Bifidobacterium adolescentis]|nr:hypothetical protein BBMN23_0050 [Bifidobacterium adolescentis]